VTPIIINYAAAAAVVVVVVTVCCCHRACMFTCSGSDAFPGKSFFTDSTSSCNISR